MSADGDIVRTALTSRVSVTYLNGALDALARLEAAERSPALCPVCLGRGMVPHDFYLRLGVGTSSEPEKCRSCNGKGVV